MRRLTTILSALALFAGTAQAADKLHLERIDFANAPYVRMYLTYVDGDGRVISGRQPADFKLIVDSAEKGPADDVKAFESVMLQAPNAPKDSPGQPLPMDLIIVVQNSGAMGEVIEDIKRGVKLLAGSLSDKSKVGVIVYADQNKPLAPLGAPGEAEGAATTMVVDNEGVEIHMLDAVKAAVEQLKGQPKDHRRMVVLFSDGIDVIMDRKSFVQIGKNAADAGVVIDTIGYAPFEAGRLRNLSELAKQSNGTERMCKNGGEISTQFGNVVDEVKKQYYVRFGTNIPDSKGKDLTWQVIIESQGKSAYSNTINAPMPKWVGPPPPTPGGSSWFWWVLGALLGIALVGVLVWALFLREREEPEPVEMPVAAPAPVAAPVVAKTMAIDIGADNRSPVIGWFVGVSGKIQDKTFKLKAGRTLIGTADDCDIKIEDNFASSHHCEVRFEYGAYKIIDLGSTNGIVVNDKKVREHECVDNDSLKIGRTELKFKTIS
jgi:FHA domain/von Willebrand factor type A domain